MQLRTISQMMNEWMNEWASHHVFYVLLSSLSVLSGIRCSWACPLEQLFSWMDSDAPVTCDFYHWTKHSLSLWFLLFLLYLTSKESSEFRDLLSIPPPRVLLGISVSNFFMLMLLTYLLNSTIYMSLLQDLYMCIYKDPFQMNMEKT